MEDKSTDVMCFVSVVFRHGKRAPSSFEMKVLSNDDDTHDNFYPIGLGGLTNEGKENMYKLGTELRKRYKNFLSDTYIPEHVDARSTDFPRAKMSLDLVLAGLYPPPEVQRWNQELKWQPIPTISLPQTHDSLLVPWIATPQYLDEIQRVGTLPEVVKKAEVFRPLAKKLSNLTGKPVTSITDLWLLYNGLMALKTMNHPLPEWANGIFPDGDLLDASSLQYEIANYNDLLKKLNGGMLLKRMIDDMKTTINSGGLTNTRKINLFSCHEANVAGLLAALGLYKPHVPEYSGAIIVELIKRDEAYYVKVIRYLATSVEFEEQEIPDCGMVCPFDKFVDLMKRVTPLDEEIDRTREFKIDHLSFEHKLRWAKFE